MDLPRGSAPTASGKMTRISVLADALVSPSRGRQACNPPSRHQGGPRGAAPVHGSQRHAAALAAAGKPAGLASIHSALSRLDGHHARPSRPALLLRESQAGAGCRKEGCSRQPNNQPAAVRAVAQCGRQQRCRVLGAVTQTSLAFAFPIKCRRPCTMPRSAARSRCCCAPLARW